MCNASQCRRIRIRVLMLCIFPLDLVRVSKWEDTMGVDVVYLPTYSPELNPVELVFQKLKIIFKREEMENNVRENLDAAIHSPRHARLLQGNRLHRCLHVIYSFVYRYYILMRTKMNQSKNKLV